MFDVLMRGGRPLAPLLVVLAVGMLPGCASITGSELQLISLQAFSKEGAPVAGADCRLSNDKGTWYAKPPASPTVARSSVDLNVNCEAAGQTPGSARAISRANAGMAGNIIFGGVIGVIIDHNRGTAYDYPSTIRVVFGTSTVVDKNDDYGAGYAATPMPVPAPQIPAPVPAAAAAPNSPPPAVPIAVSAQTLPPPTAPNSPASTTLPVAGAIFRYAWTEQQYSRRAQEIQVRVTGVDGSTVMETFSADGRSPFRTEVQASELAFVGRLLSEGQSMLEFSPYLQLQGRSDLPPIAKPSGYPDSGGGAWRISVQLRGSESMIVPAGAFNALRVEVQGERDVSVSNLGHGISQAIPRRFEYTAWYVPELKRYIKSRNRTWNVQRLQISDEQVELLEYRSN